MIGIGQESHNIEGGEGYSYTDYTRLCILQDPKTGQIIEIKEPKTSNTKRIITSSNGQILVQNANVSTIYAYLDASKTKGLPIIVGGAIQDNKFIADTFVTQVGNERQVFAYVIDTMYGVR